MRRSCGRRATSTTRSWLPSCSPQIVSLLADAEAAGGLALRIARCGLAILESGRSDYEACLHWAELAEETEADHHSLLELHIGAYKGWAQFMLGDVEAAKATFSSYLADATARRDGISRGFLLSKLGLADAELGDHQAAAERHHEGREIFVKAGDRGGQGYTLSRLSWTHYLMGNHELALRYALDGLEHFEAMNLRWGVAVSHGRAGLAEVALGRTTEARARFLQTITIARAASIPDQVHYGIIGVGLSLVADGRSREAAHLLLGSLAATQNPYKEIAEQGMVEVGAADVDDLEAIGDAAATLTLNELADEAIRIVTGG